MIIQLDWLLSLEKSIMREHWDVLDNIIEYLKMKNGRHWRPNCLGAIILKLLSIKDDNELIYSINIAYERNLSKRENKFVIEYCSGDRIAIREYELVWYNWYRRWRWLR